MEEIDRIVKHLLRHKDFARSVLSRSYPFTIAELREYSKILEWGRISMNDPTPIL